MKRIILLLLVCFIIVDLGQAQNLLLNPGFEAGVVGTASFEPVDGVPDPVANWGPGCGTDMSFVHQAPTVFGLVPFEGNRFAVANFGELDQRLQGEFTQPLAEGEYSLTGQYAGPIFQANAAGLAHVFLRNEKDECSDPGKQIGTFAFNPDNVWNDLSICFFITAAEADYYDRIEILTEVASGAGVPGMVTAPVALDDLAIRKTDLLREDFEAGTGGFTTGLTQACDGACTEATYCLTTNSQTHCNDEGPFTGTGNFMSVANSDKKPIYSSVQTFEIAENVTYEFSMLVHNYDKDPGPEFRVRLASTAGNIQIGSVQNTSTNAGWAAYNIVWTASTSGTFNLQIQQHSEVKDLVYGIDDIIFRERACCEPLVPTNVQCETILNGFGTIIRWNEVPLASIEVLLTPNAACCDIPGTDISGIPSTIVTPSGGNNWVPILHSNGWDCLQYQARSICPGGDTSAWSAPVCICTSNDPMKTNFQLDAPDLAAKVQVAPNPSSRGFHFTIESAVAVEHIYLANALGAVVAETDASPSGGGFQARWEPAAQLPNGTYFAVIRLSNGDLLSQKLILQR